MNQYVSPKTVFVISHESDQLFVSECIRPVLEQARIVYRPDRTQVTDVETYHDQIIDGLKSADIIIAIVSSQAIEDENWLDEFHWAAEYAHQQTCVVRRDYCWIEHLKADSLNSLRYSDTDSLFSVRLLVECGSISNAIVQMYQRQKWVGLSLTAITGAATLSYWATVPGVRLIDGASHASMVTLAVFLFQLAIARRVFYPLRDLAPSATVVLLRRFASCIALTICFVIAGSIASSLASRNASRIYLYGLLLASLVSLTRSRSFDRIFEHVIARPWQYVTTYLGMIAVLYLIAFSASSAVAAHLHHGTTPAPIGGIIGAVGGGLLAWGMICRLTPVQSDERVDN